MALKLGKCRLCLKLGDFFSIYAVDNSLQLAEMVMECTRVKVYEGDGLPDKICSECVQKLSSAYIFKQQCERSDEELRRNYVPPPGFSISPPPTAVNRQSSDSAFSNQTDSSGQAKPAADAPGPAGRRKRSRDAERPPSANKRVQELKRPPKRPRYPSGNTSFMDSDYDDNSVSRFSAETDSDEPLLGNFKCNACDKSFKTAVSLANHKRTHTDKSQPDERSKSLGENAVVNVSTHGMDDAHDSEDRLSCQKCGKSFKLKIMLKRHLDTCGKTPQVSPQKELFISLEPIDQVVSQSPPKPTNAVDCHICQDKFKTTANLKKHLKVVHAAALPNPEPSAKKLTVSCLYCHESFDDLYVHNSHFNSCSRRSVLNSYPCPICQREMSNRNSYFRHLKSLHFEAPEGSASKPGESAQSKFECRMCNRKLPSQDLLIKHLAEHVSNIDDDESRPSTVDDSVSVHSEYSATKSEGPLKCRACDKSFKYKKALETHEARHTSDEITVKTEPPDKGPGEVLEMTYSPDGFDSESSGSERDDLTCSVCDKQFSYRRLLDAHMRTKHTRCAGVKRARVGLKDCAVRCLICDASMTVGAVNAHNATHQAQGVKPRNLYTCRDCGDQFKSCTSLATHIKIVHRLKQAPKKDEFEGADLADFCEVVVTKAEPLDDLQTHNGLEGVPRAAPSVNLAGFTCPICGKQMKTLLSLKRHVNWHSNVGNNLEKKLECFVCKETFRFQSHYKLHMRAHSRDPHVDPALLTCGVCGRRSQHLRAAQAHTNYHKQTRFNTRDYQCSICKRVFQFRKVYLSHMAIHYKRGEGLSDTVVGHATPKNADLSVFDGTHTCHLCGKVCASEVSLKHHVTWHRSKTMLYGARHECPVCHTLFTNKKRLELHVREHYEDPAGPHYCQVCGKGFSDEDYFRRHVKGHNFDHQSHQKRLEKLRKNKVKCPICSRYYADLVKLIRHLRRTHPESKMIKPDPDAPPPRYFSCKLCAKAFLDEKRLRHHEESHLRKPSHYKCKFCFRTSLSMKQHNIHIKAHLVKKHIDNPLKCPQCPEMFIRGYDLHYHLRDVHGVTERWIADPNDKITHGPLQDLQCSICLKVLASKGNYERHIDFHNTLRCNYCFEYFSTHRFLEGHLAFSCAKRRLLGDTEVHARKVKCYICYKAFHLQVKLDCHLRTQHGIKVNKEVSQSQREIVCDYCFRVFENTDALNTHKIYHRTVGYYGCIYCSKKFLTLTGYRKHKNHHFSQLNVDNPTKCEHCDETFVAFREMIYHMKDEHGDDKEWIVEPTESIEEKCNICDKVFFNLHRHLAYHEQNRCKKCAEYFFSRHDFDSHLCSIESDEEVNETNENSLIPKYEECAFCFKPVTKKVSKRLHNQMHTSSGSISCRFCPLKFKTMDAFNIHAFSHRSRKYTKKPLKCRECGEKFTKYGPFIKHMRVVHKSKQKMHYRGTVKPDQCVVCGDFFPNLHNHYRAHLLNQCQLCKKYFTSAKVFSKHECDKEDSDPTKVFTSDANLKALINSYVPQDEKDDEKYIISNDADEEDISIPLPVEEKESQENHNNVDEKSPEDPDNNDTNSQDTENEDENSQSSMEKQMHLMAQTPIISDVLSLLEKKEAINQKVPDENIVCLTDDDDEDISISADIPIITID